MSSLFSRHPQALSVLLADIEGHALQQELAFAGTAGSVNERRNASGFRFYAHQYYDGEGKQRETYVAGPVGDAEADRMAEELKLRIHEARGLLPSIRMLGREGFQLVDAKTFATVATLHNHQIFAAGGFLVGSHAYGVLLNRLGARAAAYSTEDVDIARGTALAFAELPEVSLLEILQESGVRFVEVPSLDPRAPSTAFKQRGRSRFRVDLLVPSRDDSFPTVPVPELNAHAQGLPHLGFLLAESQMAVLLARQGCCTIRVPLPERFAIHKLLVSQLRTGRDAKSAKDVHQACVLAATLAETHPGALEDVLAQVPVGALGHVRSGIAAARPLLADTAPRAWEELSRALV